MILLETLKIIAIIWMASKSDGANFTQGYQSLKHSNTAAFLFIICSGISYSQSQPDVQLTDGVMCKSGFYMSAHHHNEFWVKVHVIRLTKAGLAKRLAGQTAKPQSGSHEINYMTRTSEKDEVRLESVYENNIKFRPTTLAMFGKTNGEIQGSVTQRSLKFIGIWEIRIR